MSVPAQSPYSPPKARLSAEDPQAHLYAGFWRRVAAAMVDALVVWVVSFAVILAFGFVIRDALIVQLISIVPVYLYYALMHSSSRQATLGKMAFGIKVTDAEGARIGFLRATGRYFAAWVSYLILAIGLLMAAFTQRKQALHDMLAGTLVVRADATPATVISGGGTMKVTGGVIALGVVFGFVPVLGVLAAIAIPAYSDYTHRSHMVEVIARGNAAKLSITEFHAQHKRLPVSLQEAGVNTSPSPRVKAINADFRGGQAMIRVYVSDSLAAGGAVLFTTPGVEPLQWTCSSQNIRAQLLPANCRQPTP